MGWGWRGVGGGMCRGSRSAGWGVVGWGGVGWGLAGEGGARRGKNQKKVQQKEYKWNKHVLKGKQMLNGFTSQTDILFSNKMV